MAKAKGPTSLSIRAYHVGFGDCFLLSFGYPGDAEKHVLVDFGSTALPKGAPKSRMVDIANDIAERVKGGEFTAVVATHRHKDHVSGFATGKGKASGDIIRKLKPKLVVQPWTEDPKLDPQATGPKGKNSGDGKHVAGLSNMHLVAEQVLAASGARYWPKALRDQLAFLGEDNIGNASAVKNLMTMAPNDYVHAGVKCKLEKLLPGVEVHVLGPPTVDQSATIKKQRSSDPDQFWQFQANAAAAAVPVGGKKTALFPRHVASHGPQFPVGARWLVHHLRAARGTQTLQIVRMLDKAMNNTSVILLLKVGEKTILLPGDAQIENWSYALDQTANKKLLAKTGVYKVGHHGSRNATPKGLWALFDNRSKTSKASRLASVMSTMLGKHGHAEDGTEVPRSTLVSALKRESDFHTTETLQTPAFFYDVPVAI